MSDAKASNTNPAKIHTSHYVAITTKHTTEHPSLPTDNIRAMVIVRSTGLGFDLAWLSCHPSVSVFGVLGTRCRKVF